MTAVPQPVGPVARADEHARLGATLRSGIAPGGGAALLVRGDAGLGKTFLLDHTRAAAEAAGAVTLKVTGVDLLSDLPYATLQQLVHPLLAGVTGLSSQQRDALHTVFAPDGGNADRLVVLAAALQVLREAAAPRGLVAVVDDAHWVDKPSLSALLFVARRVTGSRLVVLLGARPGYAWPLEDPRLPTLDLAPLRSREAAALLDQRFPELDAQRRQRVLAQARGNPLALLELPTTPPWSASSRWGRQHVSVSDRLCDAFGARLAGLPAPTRRVLTVAALEGHGDLSIVLAVSGGALADLVPAERGGLVSVDLRTGMIAFRHPLVRSALVETADPAEIRMTHTRLARTAALDPDRRVRYLAATLPGSDAAVAERLTGLARRARQRGDAAGAVDALLQAAEVSPDEATRAQRLARAAFLTTSCLGDHRAARRLIGGIAPQTRRRLFDATLTEAYLQLEVEGNVAVAKRLLLDASRAWDWDDVRQPDDEAAVDAIYTLLEACLDAGTTADWTTFHSLVDRSPLGGSPQMRRLVDVLADPTRVGSEHLEAVGELIQDAGRDGGPEHLVRVATAALYLDRAEDVRDRLCRVARDHDSGAVITRIAGLGVLCVADLVAGRWNDAVAVAGEAVALTRRHAYPTAAWTARFASAFVAAGRGDEEAVEAAVVALLEWAEPLGAHRLLAYVPQLRARAALALGRPDEAFRQGCLLAPPGQIPEHVPIVLWFGDYLEAAVDSGHLAEARATLETALELGLPAVSRRLELICGTAAALTGPQQEATTTFEVALAVPEAYRWPFDLARTELAYGRHLHLTRSREAVRHLELAHELFAGIGAAPWAARAAELLRAAGRRPIGVAPAPIAALTEQERDICELAVRGLSNRDIAAQLFLSHRTVGSYLRRVYAKLGVTSRAALADALPAPAGAGGITSSD